MNVLIAEISRFVMIAALFLYVVESFIGIFVHKGDYKTGRYIRQYVYILLIHVAGMLTIYVHEQKKEILIFLVVQAAVLFIVSRVAVIIYKKISKMLLNHLTLFLVIGFVIQTRLSFQVSLRQFKIITIALILFLVIPTLIKRLEKLSKLSFVYAIVGIVLLGVVFVLGRSTYGAKLAISIMGISFQASEFVKILFVFFAASFLQRACSGLKVLSAGLVAGVFAGILVLSRDLGSALIFCITYLVMVFAGSGKYRYLVIGSAIGILASFLAYKLFSHVQVRVDTWLDPFADVDGKGYQLTQSLFAISTGGWFGSGLCEGLPRTIPFVEEDFVFSAIAEELGTVFAILLILAYLSCVLLFLKVAGRRSESFYRLIAVGLTASFGTQIVLTVGGGTRFIPLTGVTLPLVSIGGTSVMATIFMFAIIAGVSLRPEGEAELMSYDDIALPPDDVVMIDEEGNEVVLDEPLYYETINPETGKKELKQYDPEKEEAYEEELNRISRKRIVAKRQFILVTAILFMLLFSGMIFNLSRFMIVSRDEVMNNNYNLRRQKLLAEKVSRGIIYSSDGEILAENRMNGETEYRYYPYGRMFAHIVGYASNGRMGIEKDYNTYLATSSVGLVDKLKAANAGLKDPGNNVYATVDYRLQKAAFDAMGNYKGAIIVTEVSTGRVLCMVSKPDFDPGSIEENWDSYISDDKNSVLVNRVTQGLYPPGSTFKIITTLEYIRQNPDAIQNYVFECNGSFTKEDNTISCYNHHKHGSLDLMNSFAKSCNSSFSNLGVTLDPVSFAKTLDDLYFNGALPTELEHNKSILIVDKDISVKDLMQTVIGQGETQITPLHLNMITAAIANHGKLMKPYVVDRVETGAGSVLHRYHPHSAGMLLKEDEADILMEYMRMVVEDGTGYNLKGCSFTSGGKTGSAEINAGRDSHAWFTGFAPAEDPQIAITVILEGAGSGGDYAVPAAKQVLQKYFDNIVE